MKLYQDKDWIIEDFSDDILKELEGKKTKILTKWGLHAEAKAIQYESAVDTGRLRNSITHALHKDSGKEYAYKDKNGKAYKTTLGSVPEDSVAIGTNVEYAPYIEFGTHGKAGVHFLEKAITQHLSDYKQMFEEELKK